MKSAVLWMVALVVSLPAAGPVADVLQRGIYTQETLGDLDAAIGIYREVIASPTATRAYTAQAWYRLGECLRGKGDGAGAASAFQTLVRDYPEQQELVDKARAGMPGSNGLLPPPWLADEIAEYRCDDGTPRLIWAMTRVTHASAGSRFDIRFHWPPTGASEVNKLTLQRILTYASARGSIILQRTPASASSPGNSRAKPATQTGSMPGTVSIHPATPFAGNTSLGRPDSPVRVGAAVLEVTENELWYGLRRLSMVPGEERVISVRAPDRVYDVHVRAVSVDDVQVPAGHYRALRLDLSPGGSKFWIATNSTRPLVKFEGTGIRGELARLSNGPTVSRYRDPLVGYELAVPTGWFLHSRPPSNGGPGMCVELIDLETNGSLSLCGKRQETPAERIETDLRKGADARIDDQRQRWPDYATRGPYQMRSSHGQTTLTMIGDYTVDGSRRVDYSAWAQTESTRASMTANAAAEQFESFRLRVQPVLDSFRIP
jgi:hypothetical protein